MEMGFGPMRQVLPHFAGFAALLVAGTSASRADSLSDMWQRLMSPSEPTVAEIEKNIEKKRTRFRIGLEKHIKFQVFSLASPNRVVVELPNVKLRLPPPVGAQPVGLVKAFRGGKSAPGRSRIVIEVTEPVIVDKASIRPAENGYGQELAVDIIPVSPVPVVRTAQAKPARSLPPPTYNLGASGLQPPLPARAQRPSEIKAKSYKPVIVIDPGHGGHEWSRQNLGHAKPTSGADAEVGHPRRGESGL